MGGFAWVTLATNDSYSLGALVLAHSLRQVNTVHQLAVLVTPGVTPVMRAKLASVFNVVVDVNILDSKDEANLRLLKRPELGVTFTKLHCWRLTQFEKCVFLDADTMVLANADELFDKEEFSAAPDVGWPDCFNSGVFVYRPSEETYSNIVKFALERGSFDGGDQGLLNLYFSDWAHKDISKHLPFIYNTCSTACYSYLPAFKQFGGNVKIIHFIGSSKPWLQYFDSETRQVQVGSDLQHLRVVLQQWWNIFCSCIHPILSPEMAGLAGAFARLTLGAPRTAEQAMLEDQLRRQGWEVGNIDYMGRDSFDNIWTKICETLNTAPAPPDQSQEPSHAVPSEAAKQATTADITPTPPPESVSKPEFTKPQSTQLSEVAATQSEQPAVIPLPKAPTEVPVAKSETVALQSKCGKTEDTEKPILPPTPISPISVCPVGAPSTPAPIPKQQIVSPPIALPDSPTVCELPKPAPSLMSELQKPTPPQAETQKTTVSAPIPPQPATAPHSVATSAPTPVTPKPIVPQAEAQKPTVDTSKAAPPTNPAEKQKAPDAPAPSAPKTVTQPPTTVPPQSVPQKPTVEASKPAPPAKHDEKAKAPSPSPPKIASEAPKAVTAPPAQKPTPAPTVDTSKPVPPAKSDDKEKAPAASPPSKAPSKTTAKPTPAKPADPAPAKPAEPTPAKPADPKPTTPPADAGPTPPPRKSTAGGGSAPKKPAAKGGKK
ncbi:glycogenin-2-like isoform X3 [Photinus pyralis]|uniref:glycogenin-2-like isoform X3 n=1 Tax=Photinus pyralis TaxID=7054 RepID=UPI001266E72E|nr:glycogenin-2-like isoform X3 [Photinus pyralis]